MPSNQQRIPTQLPLCSLILALITTSLTTTGLIRQTSAAPPPNPAATGTTPQTGKPESKKRDVSKVEPMTVTTSDGFPLHFVYWGSEVGQEAAVVILLHGKGGHFKDWPVSFIEQLHKSGYAQILVDLRGHGESLGKELSEAERKSPVILRLDSGKLKAPDYLDMVNRDLEAIKQFIFEEHQKRYLNMNRIAIIAPEMSAPIAAAYAQLDWNKEPYEDAPDVAHQTPRGQDIRGLVLISPLVHVPGIVIGGPLRELREPTLGMAILFACGDSDRLDEGNTEKLYQSVNPGDRNKNRMYLQKYKTPLRGTELFGKSIGIEKHILEFLDRHLKGSGMEWRDRKSRLDKKKS